MKPITNIQEAIKFVKEKECGQIQEVNIKYMVFFTDGEEPFKFYDDEDLIRWCNEQQNNYFNDEVEE